MFLETSGARENKRFGGGIGGRLAMSLTVSRAPDFGRKSLEDDFKGYPDAFGGEFRTAWLVVTSRTWTNLKRVDWRPTSRVMRDLV